MKVRIGFVSNSSSSSFLVGIPTDKAEGLDLDSVKKMFGILPGSIIDGIIGEELATTLLKNEWDAEYLLDNYGADSIDELVEDYCYGSGAKVKEELFRGLCAGKLRLFRLSGNSEDGSALDGMIYNCSMRSTIFEDGTIIHNDN